MAGLMHLNSLVWTASRIESSGKRERVHLSEQTAMQLIKHGKEDWIVRREDMIEAKGKGKLVTFWLTLTGHARGPGSVASDLGSEKTGNINRGGDCGDEWNVEMPVSKPSEANQRNERLVEWNSEILLELLHRVVARRAALQGAGAPATLHQLVEVAQSIGNGLIVVEEVVEVIDMPEYVCTRGSPDVELSEVVVDQLREFVGKVASMYNDNPCKLCVLPFALVHVFCTIDLTLCSLCDCTLVHNFEHVSNVSRVVRDPLSCALS
jgi:Adenylate and Guanylate cyclase catalytic domain